jgi:hypothetical protein
MDTENFPGHPSGVGAHNALTCAEVVKFIPGSLTVAWVGQPPECREGGEDHRLTARMEGTQSFLVLPLHRRDLIHPSLSLPLFLRHSLGLRDTLCRVCLHRETCIHGDPYIHLYLYSHFWVPEVVYETEHDRFVLHQSQIFIMVPLPFKTAGVQSVQSCIN